LRIAAHDRAGLERPLRDCARPPFALELLYAESVIYSLPKSQRDATMALTLTPLELIDHLATLIPPPKRHRHRYHEAASERAIRAHALPQGGRIRQRLRRDRGCPG
jgi:hypothetical protein